MSSAIPSFPTAGLECFALSTFVLLAQLCYINQSGSSQCLWPKESSWLSIRATHYLSTAAQAKPWQNSSSLNLPLVLASTPSSAPLPHLLLLLALQFQPRQQKNCWKKKSTIFIPAWKKKKKEQNPKFSTLWPPQVEGKHDSSIHLHEVSLFKLSQYGTGWSKKDRINCN